ncbi:MAG: hypothetical protein BWX66_01054 [Deltaproteobacteria bacterium ADurb.Bin058]|nr:MAG: hypothetical protein BWX66_01054 [Deltaproteobacteria bacterium ADurb.Bin058]
MFEKSWVTNAWESTKASAPLIQAVARIAVPEAKVLRLDLVIAP